MKSNFQIKERMLLLSIHSCISSGDASSKVSGLFVWVIFHYHRTKFTLYLPAMVLELWAEDIRRFSGNRLSKSP